MNGKSESKRRPLTAQQMGRKRWKDISKADRRAHALKMVEARQKPKKDSK